MSIFSCGNTLKVFYTGSSYKLDIQVLDGSTGLPKNISTFTNAQYIVQDSERSEEAPYITKTLGDGIEILDGGGGLVRITLLKDDTKDLPQGVLQHEASLWDAEGNSVVILAERLSIKNANSTTI